jgi:hypothetical protein
MLLTTSSTVRVRLIVRDHSLKINPRASAIAKKPNFKTWRKQCVGWLVHDAWNTVSAINLLEIQSGGEQCLITSEGAKSKLRVNTSQSEE